MWQAAVSWKGRSLSAKESECSRQNHQIYGGVSKMRKSVLKEWYPDTVKFREMNGCEVPVFYTGIKEEYDTLRKQVGLIDGIGYSILEVSGESAIDFLDILATREVRYLNSGKIIECLFLNEKAEVLGISYIADRGESFLVMTPPENGEAVAQWIKENAKGKDGITVTDFMEQNSLLFLEGEKSWKMVGELFDFQVETLGLRDMTEVCFDRDSLILARIGRSGEYGYAVLGVHAAVAKLAGECLERYGEDGVKLCGTEALGICMLEITQPKIDGETEKAGNLFELSQQWLVQFDKENYCGHECLMKQFESKIEKKSVGFLAHGLKNLERKTKIFLEEEEVGSVLYGQYDPALGGFLGMALMDAEIAVSGITLSVRTEQEPTYLTTLSSPFVRPASWDTQME